MTAPSCGAVVLIGAGRMGGALLRGWIAAGRYSAIHVVEPTPTVDLQKLADAGTVALYATFGQQIPAVDAIVLAIKPQVVKGATDLLAALGQRKALILSIAAGVTSSFLSQATGAQRIVRAMPNTPGAIGRGITALHGDARLSAADRKMAEALMGSLGETLWLADERLMDAVTAVSGSGPAYVFLMTEALADAGRAQGLDAITAERLARATVCGAGALLSADKRPAAILRKEVTSPGGTTEAALSVLMGADGLNALMLRAVDAATKRGKELGKD